MLRKQFLSGKASLNRKQKRLMKKSHAKRVTAFALAGLLAISGITLPGGSSVFAADTDSSKILAFAGAEGGGRYATGGRGYDVYVVTTLEDYTSSDTPIEGSLRYGIEQVAANNGGTIIVFNVGGTIELKQSLRFDNKKNITIAGQTAPGDGITLSGWDTNISNSENLIIRYVRFRPGAANVHGGGDSMDALWGRDNDTFILDHCSFSWNTDETLSTYRGKNGTVQWCIISESLTVSGHSKGRHGYGGIFGGDNVLFQYNLIANHTSRNPRVGGGCMGDPTKDGGSTATVQLSNNVLYNWGYNTCYGGGYAYTNYINNFLKAGVGTRDAVANQVIDMGEYTKPGGFYVNGNYLVGNEEISADNSLGSKMSGATEGDTITEVATTPYTAEGFASATLVSAQECYEEVLGKAGATYPYRDAIDARVVAETVSDNGRYVNTEDEVGGYPAAETHRDASFDTDMDGIPDTWETAHGLNPNDATDSKTINSATGYAYVEEYFNGLVEEVQSADYYAPNPDITLDLANNAQYKLGEDVTVTATATAKDNNSIAKVEFYNGITLVGTDTEAPYTCTYTGLEDGTYNITARAYDNEGNQTQSSVSKLHINSTASTGEWTSTDIGNPGVDGSASLTDGVLTVKGAGKIGKSEGCVAGGEWSDATTDNFQYTYQKVTGDAEIITRLDSATAVDNHVFTGVMFRETLDTDSKAVGLGLSLVKISNDTTWSTYLINRDTTDGNISEITETIDSPSSAEAAGIPLVRDINFKTGTEFNGTWFKLVRSGDTFTGYSSADGSTWTKVGSKTVEMAEEIYVGFAVDGNKVANDLDNLSTAKFSNITINEEFADVAYDLTNVTTQGADYAAVGCEFGAQLETVSGYTLPESITVTVDGTVLAAEEYTYNAETGVITIPGTKITSSATKVVIKAEGKEKEKIIYKLDTYGDTADLTVTDSDNALTLSQTAASSSMVSTMGTEGKNVSYILFNESDDVAKMTLTLKVNSFKNGKSSGVYVGAFQSSGDYLFASVGFRGTGDGNAVSGYWIKKSSDATKDGKSGNGSPKEAWVEGDTYEITFEKKSGVYYATYKAASGVLNEKIFKSSEAYLTPDMSAQFGIAINSAEAVVTNLMLYDEDGNVLYNQNSQTSAEVDYTALDSAILAAESLTAADYKDFTAVETALAAAKSVNKETATQSDVDTLVKNLNDAVAALEKVETTPDTPDDPETPVIPTDKKNGFYEEDGLMYWYEDGVKQGVQYNEDGSIDLSYRGKEIYDPDSKAWYWLDNVQNGAVAKSKLVYQETAAGIWADNKVYNEDGSINTYLSTGKWVRYDENGLMLKGWKTNDEGTYYFDMIYGTMARGTVTIGGVEYRFDETTGILLDKVFVTDDGIEYWYEGGIKQGTEGRGKEIYDPATDAWYWLDAIDGGKKATGKDVYQESWAGQYADREDGTGKWVRYDENGAMIKGWNEQNGNTYYFDLITGAMAKGTTEIDGVTYTFDWATGVLQK